MKYDPGAPLHDRYKVAFDFVNAEEWQHMANMCLTINSFFGWDFNSCEALRQDGVFYPIDFANACPGLAGHLAALPLPMAGEGQAQVVALRRGDAAEDAQEPRLGAVLRDRRLAARRSRRSCRSMRAWRTSAFESDRFAEFCAQQLPHLDEVAWEFFGTPTAKEAVRKKVAALFPAHEVEEFTEHFWGLVQFWRRTEEEYIAKPGAAFARVIAKRTEVWRSSFLAQEVAVARWGEDGQPVLLFPTAGGDAEEIERFRMVDALAPLVRAGRIQLFSCDSVPGQCWVSDAYPASHCSWVQNRFDEFLYLRARALHASSRGRRERDPDRRGLARRALRAGGGLPASGRIQPCRLHVRQVRPRGDARRRADVARLLLLVAAALPAGSRGCPASGAAAHGVSFTW
jgi:hypothetical protein